MSNVNSFVPIIPARDREADKANVPDPDSERADRQKARKADRILKERTLADAAKPGAPEECENIEGEAAEEKKVAEKLDR